MSLLRNLLGTVAIAMGLGGQASAAPCVGFTDVDDASAFCASVEWMKNRGITTGCTATTYCPASPVTRLAMAAFLNRVANALTPIYLGSNISWNANNNTLTPGVIACPAGNYTPTFPGRAHGFAVASALSATNADADVALQFVVSTDGGATYLPASGQQVVTSSGSSLAAARAPTVFVILPPTDLAPGTNYRFALRIARATGSPTTADAGGTCQVHVLIENRNPASPPLDGAAAAGSAPSRS